ncbi:hypothetical protein [Ramlibacter montanisoli]|uniref:Uncharacterized protein n=1 Tax=Ramlibacter montanisoli TaxID=2732512 RepID=A0A849KJT2_9BURK|nr:hypothetical protein [Ramlibacter montanisoli]NNU44771.1 hypothetical protein [Ramlibacter montanisoli]
MDNTTIEQTNLVNVLTQAGEAIARADELAQLRWVIAGVSTLCVGISPGKGRVVDFLVKNMAADLQGFRTA